MLGKDNRSVQQQFLNEMHLSCADRLKDMRDTEFTESYIQLLGQLIKSDCELVNVSGINLDLILSLCKQYSEQVFGVDPIQWTELIEISLCPLQALNL